MNRATALLVVAGFAAATAALLLGPAWLLAPATVAATLALRRGRLVFVAFTASTLAINAVLFVWLVPTGNEWHLGWLAVDTSARDGIVAGLRLSSVIGTNLAALAWIGPAALLEGMRLPTRATAFLAAILIAAQDVGRDARRVLDAQRLEGPPARGRLGGLGPLGRLARAREVAALLPILVVLGVRRAHTRREALWLAGHATGPFFVPLVAVTALAAAGRLALLALPNIALTYVVVFAGGLLFGTRIGVLAGLLSMTLTDLLLTGFLPSAFANAFAMAVVGALGGFVGRIDFAGASRTDRIAGAAFAAVAGVASTLLFSVAADTLSWLMVPELRAHPELLRANILLGLAFNVVPALVNGILFAVALGPLQSALRAAGMAPAKHHGPASAMLAL